MERERILFWQKAGLHRIVKGLQIQNFSLSPMVDLSIGSVIEMKDKRFVRKRMYVIRCAQNGERMNQTGRAVEVPGRDVCVPILFSYHEF